MFICEEEAGAGRQGRHWGCWPGKGTAHGDTEVRLVLERGELTPVVGCRDWGPQLRFLSLISVPVPNSSSSPQLRLLSPTLALVPSPSSCPQLQLLSLVPASVPNSNSCPQSQLLSPTLVSAPKPSSWLLSLIPPPVPNPVPVPNSTSRPQPSSCPQSQPLSPTCFLPAGSPACTSGCCTGAVSPRAVTVGSTPAPVPFVPWVQHRGQAGLVPSSP